MQQAIISLFLTFAVTTANASGSCGTLVSRLLSTGDAPGLNKLFESGNVTTQESLAELIRSAGELSNLKEVAAPRFKSHYRASVVAPELPSKYTYAGHRINATSAKLGEVQLHLAVKPGNECTLLAVHLDSAPR